MSKCKTCKADIVWLKTKSGKSICVNPPRFPNGEINHESVKNHKVFNPKFMITHFATCPDANQHRKDKD